MEQAKAILENGGYTCVLRQGDALLTSRLRGVAPLLGWLDAGTVAPGFAAADKVVGRATAYLYCLMGATAVYAGVISDGALEVLSQNGIRVQWGQRVPYIRNRSGDGMCPMEAATADAHTPQQALAAIRAKLQQLKKA